jgi:hypothetical protein
MECDVYGAFHVNEEDEGKGEDQTSSLRSERSEAKEIAERQISEVCEDGEKAFERDLG